MRIKQMTKMGGSIIPEGGLNQWLHVLAWILVFSMSWGAFFHLMPLTDSIWRAFINTFSLGLMFYSTIWLSHHYYEQGRYGSFILAALVLLVSMTAIRFFINIGFAHDLGNTNFQQEPIAVFAGVLFTNILAILISFLHEIIRLKRKLKTRQVLLQKEEKEAQLQFLRTQMNPHFLFNTLNNIYSLAVVKSDKTAPLVMRLSDLLKYVIYDSQDGPVSLTKEVKLLKEYIELFQLQQENPQNVKLSTEGIIEDVMIEPLLLVPVVENCFKHCDFASNTAAFTRISLSCQEGTMILKAQNSYNPDQKQKDAVGGVGLPNIKRRLQLQYPDAHEMKITQEDGIFELFLSISINSK